MDMVPNLPIYFLPHFVLKPLIQKLVKSMPRHGVTICVYVQAKFILPANEKTLRGYLCTRFFWPRRLTPDMMALFKACLRHCRHYTIRCSRLSERSTVAHQ